MVARLSASASSSVDVVEAGRFLADENANNIDAVSIVSFFSDDPISLGMHETYDSYMALSL